MDGLNSLAQGTTENIIASVVVLALGAVSGWAASRVLERRPLRRVLSIDQDRGVCIVIAAPLFIDPVSAAASPLSDIPLTPIGPVFAFQQLARMLATAYPRLYRRAELFFSSDFPAFLFGNNLLLIGRPGPNAVTGEIVSRLDLPLIFEGFRLLDRETGRVYEAEFDEKGQVCLDYGCIMRLPNPFEPEANVFVVAGCQTYGVKAAAEFLERNLKDLIEDSRARGKDWRKGRPTRVGSHGEYYQAVVVALVRGHYTSMPQKVLVRRFSKIEVMADQPEIPPVTGGESDGCEYEI